jgi:hypothetical protein
VPAEEEEELGAITSPMDEEGELPISTARTLTYLQGENLADALRRRVSALFHLSRPSFKVPSCYPETDGVFKRETVLCLVLFSQMSNEVETARGPDLPKGNLGC